MDTTDRIQLIRRMARDDLVAPAIAATLTGDWSQGVFLRSHPSTHIGPEIKPGDELDHRYSVESELGRGGFGVVHEAIDQLTGDRVAIKSMLVPDPVARDRLRREASIMRLLHMPGVVAYRDEVSQGETIHLVTELISGEAFPGPLERSWASMGTACVAVLETLCRVHDAGVIHRDVKPANVLVTSKGRPFVLDFGIAEHERVAVEPDKGRSNAMGTPWYFAPELFLGQPPSELSDLYATALMLLEGLTGRLPGEDASFQKLLDNRMRGLPEVHDPPRDIPDEVLFMLTACLHPDPDRRPVDVASVVQVLRRHTPETVPLPPPGPVGLVETLAQRARAASGLAVAAEEDVDLTPLAVAVRDKLVGDGIAVHARELDDDAWQSKTAEGVRAQRMTLTMANDGLHLALETTLDDVPADVWVSRWKAPDLTRLLHGPDALFHLREDGAQVLATRTLGIPDRVADELGWWVRAAYATVDDGRLRLDPRGLDHLRSGMAVDPAPRGWGHDGVDALMGDVLRALALAAHPVPSPAVAAMLEVPLAEVEAAVTTLARAGRVGMVDGVVHALTAAEAPRWSAQRRLDVRRRLVHAVPAGTVGRLLHLVVLGEPGPIVEEAQALVDHHRRAGTLTEAWSAACEGHTLACRHGLRDDALRLLHAACEVALARATPVAMQWVAHAARNVGAVDIARLAELGTQTLIGRGPEVADELASLPPLPGILELWRWSVRSFALATDTVERQQQALAELEARAGANVDGQRWALMARSRLAYAQGDFATAARLHRASGQFDGLSQSARVSSAINTSYALLETGDLEGTESASREALAMLHAVRHPTHEAHLLWTLRSVCYRNGRPDPVSPDLDEALALLGLPLLIQQHNLATAAFAYRTGGAQATRAIVSRCLRCTGPNANVAALLLGIAADVGIAMEAAQVEQAIRTAIDAHHPGVTLQILALLAPHLGAAEQERLRELARTPLAKLRSSPHQRASQRREVLSIEQACARLGLLDG